MKKKHLHKPPAELKEALALEPEKRRRKRNKHTQGDGLAEDYKRERGLTQARRSAHRVPLKIGGVVVPAWYIPALAKSKGGLHDSRDIQSAYRRVRQMVEEERKMNEWRRRRNLVQQPAVNPSQKKKKVEGGRGAS